MLQPIAADILQRGLMGGFIDFQPGDGAGFIPAAQEQPQGAAAGAKIQNPGVFGKADKVAEHHGVGA